ncbi:MAG: TAXI family TRAP transporter solute-binding subunit [Alphaproteobacteria bacterium]
MQTLLQIAAIVLTALALPGTGHSAEANWPERLTIGTASPGGTYYQYGEGLARLLTRKLGVAVAARETEGPVENLKLIDTGELDLAFVTLGIAQQGWSGAGDWTAGKQFRSARALFPMYDTPFQFIVPVDSSVQSVADFAGKQVGIGPQGGTGGVYTPLLFKAIKVDAQFATGSWQELAGELAAHRLDALVAVGGVPLPEVTDLEAKGAIRSLALTPSQTVAVRLALPEIAPSIIAAGTYPSLRRNYRTVGLYNFAVARAGLPADLVSAILDAVFDNPDEMMAIHPGAAETVPANFSRNTVLPFHEGAARWYNNKATIGVVRGD